MHKSSCQADHQKPKQKEKPQSALYFFRKAAWIFQPALTLNIPQQRECLHQWRSSSELFSTWSPSPLKLSLTHRALIPYTPAGKHELRMPGWYPHNPQAERISFHNQSSWPNMGTLLHIVLENANRDYNSHQTLIPKCNKARIMPSEVFATRSKTKVL